MKYYKSSAHYVLLGLVPYSKPNLKLTFKPKQFFQELETLHKINQHTARNAYSRLRKQEMIEFDQHDSPRLTEKGRKAIRPYTSKILSDAKILVVFDIPESERWKRRQLRLILKGFSFRQIQKSVWESPLDCAAYIYEEVKHLKLGSTVNIYEARKL